MSNDNEYYQAAVERITSQGKSVIREQFQLPLFPDHQRAAPSALLRSALFGIGNKPRRVKAEWQDIITTGWDWQIKLSGAPLNQIDLSVWLEVLHQSRQVGLIKGNRFTIKTRTLAKALKRSTRASVSGHDIDGVCRSLQKLAAANLRIKIEGGLIVTHLIHTLIIPDDTNRRATIVMDPETRQLFDHGYTRVEAAHRLQLRGALTKWLHGYVMSHRATKERPSWIGLDKLRLVCGSDRTELRMFRYDVKKSMVQLRDLGLVNFRFSEDKLTLVFYHLKGAELLPDGTDALLF